jgi:hypothetical protein
MSRRWHKWVHRLFQPSRPLSQGRGRSKHFSLLLEPLEERVLLATVNWIGSSGDWDTPGNWLDAATQTNHVPGAGDDAVISTAGITVTHTSAAVDAVRSLSCKAALTLAAGQVSLAVDSIISNGFTLSGGTLSGPGNLTVTSAMDWTDGSMVGGGKTIIAAGATLNVPGSNTKHLDNRTIANAGVFTWISPGFTGPIDANDGSVINNTGIFNLVEHHNLAWDGLGTAPAVFNSGSIRIDGTVDQE